VALFSIRERFAAWLLTGPVGHFAAALADFAVLFWRLGRARLRDR
jgi:hypothetical protein